MSLKKANEHRNAWFEGVQKCHLDESLYTVMEKIVRAEVHRLVVTDENEKVIGIISLSDILLYLVLRPSGDGIGESESLRASDPILRERTDSVSTALPLYNNSNESIEEETNNELEAEKAGDGLKKKIAGGDEDDADDNNNSVEEAEEAIPVPENEEKTEDNLNDNANNNNEPSSPVKSDSNDEVIDIEDEEEDEDEAENELTITSNNNTLSNSLSIQREVAMVSE